MKKIKILTFSRAHNYGAVLQAFALQEVLKNEGNKVNIIDYRNENIEKPYIPLYLKEKSIKKNLKNFIKWIFHHRKINLRYKKFNEFIKENLDLTVPIYNDKQIEDFEKETDMYVTGSDQVWNINITGESKKVYMLDFPTRKAKISYAASVGDKNVILKNKDFFIEKLKGYEYISVREEDAQIELKKILNQRVDVVLDPTLLITKKEWDEKIKNNNVNIKEKYIFAYVISPDVEYVKIVNELSAKTGLKVVHFGMRNPGYENVLKSAYTDGPFEFINYIKNAEYVVATSFHATVFSIIYNKNFFIVPHRKTGARVTNLLKILEIKNRTFYKLEEFNKIDYDNSDIDWQKTEELLEKERKNSLNLLRNAVNKNV